jgi:hypothetical protein
MASYVERTKASGPREGFNPNPKLNLLDHVNVIAQPGLRVRSPLDF